MEHHLPLVIGIAGGSGSGKTTVANAILQRVGPQRIAYLPHDAYYRDLSQLPPVQRAQVNFDHPNSLETELLVAHVQALRQGQGDRSTHLRLYHPFPHLPHDTRRTLPCHSGRGHPDLCRA